MTRCRVRIGRGGGVGLVPRRKLRAGGRVDRRDATPIGPICHELGHDLGLPDLYDLDGSSYRGGHALPDGVWGMGGGGGRGRAGDAGAAVGVVPGQTGVCGSDSGEPWPGVIALVEACDPANANILEIQTSNPDEYFLVGESTAERV